MIYLVKKKKENIHLRLSLNSCKNKILIEEIDKRIVPDSQEAVTARKSVAAVIINELVFLAALYSLRLNFLKTKRLTNFFQANFDCSL